ncbi:MAG: hypothetical protein WAV72_10190 [Bradyrhizobium sp.]
MDRRQLVFGIVATAALSGLARDGHAECGELTAVEFVEGLYAKQARLHAANTPLTTDEFHALFASDLRKLMQAPRRTPRDAPIGPLLNAFFGWGVLPGTEIKVEKLVLVSGNHEGPATVGVDLKYRGESRKILVHAVRENEVWLVANIIYDSGKSLVAHYRSMTAR